MLPFESVNFRSLFRRKILTQRLVLLRINLSSLFELVKARLRRTRCHGFCGVVLHALAPISVVPSHRLPKRLGCPNERATGNLGICVILSAWGAGGWLTAGGSAPRAPRADGALPRFAVVFRHVFLGRVHHGVHCRRCPFGHARARQSSAVGRRAPFLFCSRCGIWIIVVAWLRPERRRGSGFRGHFRGRPEGGCCAAGRLAQTGRHTAVGSVVGTLKASSSVVVLVARSSGRIASARRTGTCCCPRFGLRLI